MSITTDMQEVQSLLATMYSRSNNLQPVMHDIGREVKDVIRLSFAEEKNPFGTPWQQSKRAEATNGKTLFLSGQLFNSFTFRSSIRSVKVGTSIIYGAIHNYGGSAGKNHSVVMPKRQFMPIDNNNDLPPYLWADIKDLIYRHMDVD